MNSASARLRAPATRTSSPSVSCGLTLRARRWRSDTFGLGVDLLTPAAAHTRAEALVGAA